MRNFLLALAFSCAFMGAAGQERPRLVVGIVVDQMRWDYLERFADRYGDGGLKRMMREGFSFDNCQINYIPTITAVGHTSVYTGSVPSIHGIVGNSFRDGNRWQYCTEDTLVAGVEMPGKAGRMSPNNLLTTTIGDELKLATNFRSKVVGVSLKDRAAILPAGHCADAAYWLSDETGGFGTSTFYMAELPAWVRAFNKKALGKKLLGEKWETLYPLKTYKQSTPDDAPYEGRYAKNHPTTFPYDIPAIAKEQGFGLLRSIPAGTTLTFAMAKAALEGESLGRGGECDMLTVSISPTDYIGHQFGINAVEIEDAYLRLDRDMADFFSTLDAKVGKGQYLVFLTADHGAAHNISFNQDHHIPSRPWNMGATTNGLRKHLAEVFGTEQRLVFGDNNCMICLDHEGIAKSGLKETDVRREAVDFLKQDTLLAYVADMEEMLSAPIPQPIRERAVNGYNRRRSGDIATIPVPGTYGTSQTKNIKGTTHGVWNPYDAHIPCVFMGWHVPAGRTAREVHITDIAATVCAMLRIQMPNGCVGEPLREVAK